MINLFRPNFESKYAAQVADLSAFLNTLEHRLARVGADLEVSEVEFTPHCLWVPFVANGIEMSIAWTFEDKTWVLDASGSGITDTPTLAGLADTLFHFVRPPTHQEIKDAEDEARYNEYLKGDYR